MKTSSSNKDRLEAVRDLLEQACDQYNRRTFITDDPISIPHRYSKKEDREIAGLLAATIAWGNRKSILANGRRLMSLMDDSPFEFVTGASRNEKSRLQTFVHRTFNGNDCRFFIDALGHLCKKYGGLENAFQPLEPPGFGVRTHIESFRKRMLETMHEKRVEKHISDPGKNSSAKRLCMFLRWMIRKDKRGVDFGIWNSIDPSELCLPLDVHTGNVSRKLKLLARKQNDWKTVEEITGVLRTFDPLDPVRFDFALFGIGVHRRL